MGRAANTSGVPVSAARSGFDAVMGTRRGDGASAREQRRLDSGGVDAWWHRLPHADGPATAGLVLILDTCATRGMSRISLVDEGVHYRLSAASSRSLRPDSDGSEVRCASWIVTPELAGWLMELAPKELHEPRGTPTSPGHYLEFCALLFPRGQTFDAASHKRRR